MCEKIILIIGEIFIDTHIDIIYKGSPLVRLGGIFHSARAFSAIGAKYALAYFAPDYLEDDINYYSCKLKTTGCYKLGSIDKAPNVMLVNESKEICQQGYCNINKDQAIFKEMQNILFVIEKIKPTDILLYPGRYNMKNILTKLNNFNGKIHIDFHYDYENILNYYNSKIETAILSTSSSLFKNECKESLSGILEYFKNSNVTSILVKENRGGAYSYYINEDQLYQSPAYNIKTMHSVGVGDVYNSIYITDYIKNNHQKNMRLAAYCAAKYAETMDFDKFKDNIQNALSDKGDILSLDGVRLSWEEKKNKNIYLAAPDFPAINTELLTRLSECLTYHNFKPRLPIRENGLAENSMTLQEKIGIYHKDIKLLQECDLLIAVLLYNDPGTLVELGMFKQMGKPTIIYDPYNICSNMFVRFTPRYLCYSIDEVIAATYICLKRG